MLKLNLKPIYQTPPKYAFNVMCHISSISKWNYVVLHWIGKMNRYNRQRILPANLDINAQKYTKKKEK